MASTFNYWDWLQSQQQQANLNNAAFQGNPNNAFPNATPPPNAQTVPSGMSPGGPGGYPAGPPRTDVGAQVAGAGGQVSGVAAGSQLGGMLGGPPPATPNLVGASSNAMPPMSFGSGASSAGYSLPGGPPGVPNVVEATNIPGGEALPGFSPTGSAGGAPGAAASGVPAWLGGSSPWGVAGNAGAIAAGAATGYQQAKGVEDIAQGDKLSVGEQAALALPTFGASLLYNPARNFFTSGKDKDQHSRDAIRAKLVESGFLNPDYTYDLGDGNKFDWGKDGNARLPNSGKDPLSGQDWRHYYDVDWSKDSAGGVVAAANPLAAVFAKGDKKLTRDYAGYITNTAMAGKDPIEVIQGMIEKAGMDHDKIYGAIHLMSKAQGGSLDDKTADAYKNGLDQLYGVGHYEGQGSQLGKPDIQPGQKSGGQSPQAANPPMGSAQQRVPAPAQKSSPFIGSPNYTPKPGYGTRVSPGVYKDSSGKEYLSKDGRLNK